ncbi:MAG: hypothetical protein HW421_3935 [Ignavibacteria bacterium]|nr:hypothetical protein [Ignavibacteria bacterium]
MGVKLKNICILFFLVTIISCSSIEIKKEYYENGSLQAEYQTKNGHFDGYFIGYHENGILAGEGNFKNDKQIGIWKFYYKNGNLLSKSIFDDNGEILSMDAWDISGNHCIINGNGTLTIYHDNGKPDIQTSYKNNKFHGKCLEWDKNGNISKEIYFDEGKPTGTWKYYYEDGTLMKTEKY